MGTTTTKSAIYEETAFGTLALNRTLPSIGRLFGFDSHNQRQFLGRTRIPHTRTDLFAQLDQVGLEHRPVVGFISVHQVQTFRNPNWSPKAPPEVEEFFEEVSRLQKFGVSRVDTKVVTPGHPFEFELFTLPAPEEHVHDHHELRRSKSMSDLMAVALLTAAG
jgi:hypothetical protein